MPEPTNVNEGGLTVPIVPQTASPSIITEVTLPAPKSEKLDVADALGLKPDNGIRSPEQIFGEEESAENVNARIEGRKRGSDGKFLPKDGGTPAPVATPPAKPVAKPAVAIKPAPPAAEPKIKIGAEEKTAAEWEAYHKDLAAKAEAATQPPVPKKEDEAPKPEDLAAEEKTRRDTWFEGAKTQYKPLYEKFNRAIASQDAAESENLVSEVFAEIEETIWKRIVREVGPHLDKLSDRLDGELTPIARQRDETAQLQTEANFLSANPEIKAITDADPTKLEVHREVCAELNKELTALKALAEQRPELNFAKDRVAALEKDFLSEVAKTTRAKLGIGTAAPNTASPVVSAPPAKPAAPVERPLGGDRPGGAAAPKTETNEARLAREVASM